MGQCGLDSSDSYYGQVNTVLNSRDAQNAGGFSAIWETASSSNKNMLRVVSSV